MDVVEIGKVLSNETRWKILNWLKEPAVNFPPHQELKHLRDGVCVQYIAEKSGLSVSTISHYLSMMQKANLVVPKRHGKWTYYKRNEKAIKKIADYFQKNL